MRNRFALAVALVVAALALPASALADGSKLDHPAPAFNAPSPPPGGFSAGGAGAKWEQVATIPTGNPHTDLDLFSRGGNTYASVGTLAVGPNGGGQTIVQLTDGNRVNPRRVGNHPSASCLSNPEAALGLQHDVEASPKGSTILNTDVTAADRRQTQILVDATDAPGRCHDQGPLAGIADAPQGGLEIIDVTNPAAPAVIGMTSNIGEAHTVNIDPKRPHIAYAVTSDSVDVEDNGTRENESDGNALDGFEVVDMASCMNFPAGTTLEQKRARCKPQVYRYRYPSTTMSQGHTNKDSVYACHELEIYPDDRVTCGSGAAMILLDMKNAFDNRGTPGNFRDDKPRGTPLPCTRRRSTSVGLITTAAAVTDCVDGPRPGTDDLNVSGWRAAGSPSLTGVRWIGSAFHMGRESSTGAADPAYPSSEDIDFDHEAELTNSGRFVLAADERGGGVAPPGASCSPGVDNPTGNGGIHAYRTSRLLDRRPRNASDAFGSYARNFSGGKSIFRAPIRTGPQGSLCTAHVFQQIPGQNRIFMAWYSQGTRVVDFTERSNGTLQFREAGYFIPTNANQWASQVFKVQRNANDSFTYWGLAGDFALGAGGRSTIDVYKVTLPPPPIPLGRLSGTGRGFDPRRCMPAKARLSSRGIRGARVGTSYRRFVRRYKPVRRKGKLTRVCVRGRRGKFWVGRNKRGKIDFVASTVRRHRSRRLAPRRRAPRVRISGARRVTRGVFRGRRKRIGRLMYGVRKRKVRFVGTTGKRSRNRVVVKRLRAIRFAPRAKRRRR